MIRAESTISSDNHTPFSIAWITSNPASPMAKAPDTRSAGRAAGRELNLGGFPLLIGCVCFQGTARLLLWALLNL